MHSADLPPPPAFGAPARFTEWRAAQSDAVMRILASDQRFCGVNMPCGTGKSLVPVLTHLMTGARVLVVTASKILQTQYLGDWAECGLVDVRGQGNHECIAVAVGGGLARYRTTRGPVMVDRAPCHAGVWCRLRQGGCGYFDSVRAAADALLVITNYAYWLSLGVSGREALGTFDYLFLDEADEADAEVRRVLHMQMHPARVRESLGIGMPNADTPIGEWRDWAKSAHRAATQAVHAYTEEMQSDDTMDAQSVAGLRGLKELQTQLARVARLDGEWLIADSRRARGHVEFDAVWPGAWCEELLYRGIDRIVLMSATLTEKDLDIVGAPRQDRWFREYASPFRTANRPVWIVDLGEGNRVRVDNRLRDYRWLVAQVDAAIAGAEARKVIVQSVSYKLTETIMRMSRFRRDMVTHADSGGKANAVEAYRRADGPRILISPSVRVGESFPYRQCERIIVPKLPFLDMRDPVMRRREAEDAGYGGHLMMKALAQSVGRHVRHADDRGDTVVLDDHARWAVPKFRRFAPRAFTEALRWTDRLPAPLPPL